MLTDLRTYGRTDGRTNPRIEIRGRIKKKREKDDKSSRKGMEKKSLRLEKQEGKLKGWKRRRKGKNIKAIEKTLAMEERKEQDLEEKKGNGGMEGKGSERGRETEEGKDL